MRLGQVGWWSVWLLGWISSTSWGQELNAPWMWLAEGNPARSAPAGKVWFRRELRAHEPSTCSVRVAGDDRFVLWVNGQRIGNGDAKKFHHFNLNGLVTEGINVFALEVENLEGRAGVLVEGDIRGQSGARTSCDSGHEWSVTAQTPADDWLKSAFNMEQGWTRARSLGDHALSPWKHLAFTDSYLDRFVVPEGLKLERIADPNLVGSLVAMTWGNRGRLLVSREGGPILNLLDRDGNGTYDEATTFTKAVNNCQGLCLVFDDLYVVGNGPQGTGVYRLPDRNHDDQADEVILVAQHRGGMGEHGPHDVVFGPDGWLYHNLGNHAWVQAPPQPSSPARTYYEGYLLEPKFEDGGGHAVGIKAPGGTIWRFSPDGKQWWLETNGFRNHYDIAFNRHGDLFTFDSDMEWDVGQPWYRPVRVNHCVPGGEFGWRSGAAKWPTYYFDSLPTTVDIGRGSPTGVIYYEHQHLPKKYHHTLLLCDWSMGRILAADLKQQGATYSGNFTTLLSGNPLNVSDIEVAPDGAVIFTTGGRGTEGGVYRISTQKNAKNSAKTEAPPQADLQVVFAQPQLQSAWARERVRAIQQKLGTQWEDLVINTARQGSSGQKIRALTLLSQFGPKPKVELLLEFAKDTDAGVRAFAVWRLGDHPTPAVAETLSKCLEDENPIVRRRACEAFVRAGLEAPVAPLLRLLADPDRWIRYAARLTLERVPVTKWREQVLLTAEPNVGTLGLLALFRHGQAIPADLALDRAYVLLNARSASAEAVMDALRMVQLTLLAGGVGPKAEVIGKFLDSRFPTGNDQLDMEVARVLAALQMPGAIEKILTRAEKDKSQSMQVHYALCLRYLRTGWTADQKKRLTHWYEQTRAWEGGHSFAPYLANIFGATLQVFTPSEQRNLLVHWRQHPFVVKTALRHIAPEKISDYVAVAGGLWRELDKGEKAPLRDELKRALLDGLAESGAAPAQELLRQIFDDQPDLRERLARDLARHAHPASRPYLLRGLLFGDSTTLQLCLQGLTRIEEKPAKPDETRAVLLAGLKLGDGGGQVALQLLDKWHGPIPAPKTPTNSPRSLPDKLAAYQQWFQRQYPDEPPAVIPTEDAARTRYTMPQLLALVDRDPRETRGDAKLGRLVYIKANCIKCHRFGNEGENVGPDLTSVRRRFQRKEIIESLVYPSQVISDQYRSVTVVMRDGQVHNGMRVPQTDAGKLILLLGDGTRLTLEQAKVEATKPSKVSVMPDNLLKNLSPEDIIHLFAFLETSKTQPEPGKPMAASNKP